MTEEKKNEEQLQKEVGKRTLTQADLQDLRERHVTSAGPKKVLPLSFDDLVALLKQIIDDADYWKMVYRTHTEEIVWNEGIGESGKLAFSHVELGNIAGTIEYHNRLECLGIRLLRHYYCSGSNKTIFPAKWSIVMTGKYLDTLRVKCSNCSQKYPCPTRLQAFIGYMCGESDYTLEQVYGALIGEQIGVSYPKNLEFNPNKYDDAMADDFFSFLDYASAVSAIALIRLKLLTITERLPEKIAFRYVDFTNDVGDGYLEDFISHYKGETVSAGEVMVSDFKKRITTENPSNNQCSLTQKPELIAVYFLSMAGCDEAKALELGASYIHWYMNNKKNLPVSYFLNNQKLHILRNMPFTKESIRVVERMANYIVNYAASKKVPFIPMNTVIYTADDMIAHDVAKVIAWFESYYFYYKEARKDLLREISFVEFGMEGFIQEIDRVKSPSDPNFNPKEDIKGPVVYLIKDFDKFPSMERRPGENAIAVEKLLTVLDRKKELVGLILTGDKETLSGALKPYAELNEIVLSNHLYMEDMSADNAFHSLLLELRRTYTFEDGFVEALEEYVQNQYFDSELKSKAFVERVRRDLIFKHYNGESDIDNKLLIKDIPVGKKKRATEDIWKELDQLVGLKNVKDEVHKLYDVLLFKNKAKQRGIRTLDSMNLHMIFAGNPGTGKTTVARLLGEIYFNMGVIKQNKLIEVSPKDMIGQYVGQTAPKTAAKCEAAYGGILFIDEAYELSSKASSGNAQFRNECITELIKQMEDHRDNLVVIMAGYTKDMDELLESNAGFKSRVGSRIVFEDYSLEELISIFHSMLARDGLSITPDAEALFAEQVGTVMGEGDFGNARYVRNSYEKILMEHARNTAKVDAEEERLLKITKEDIPAETGLASTNKKIKIGFI